MQVLRDALDFVLHVDDRLHVLIQACGAWSYGVLALVIFLETGLVVTPFLPGDSLLFAAGAFAARGSFDVMTLAAVLVAAAIAGDTVNYWVGAKVGPLVFRREDVRFLNRRHLERTQRFYERHGGKTIVLARFVPVVRTFAPFVAGAAGMRYTRFLAFNVLGGVLWVGVCVGAGYLFGNIPVVRDNFSLIVVAIVLISVAPAGVEVLRHRLAVRRADQEARPS